MGHFKISAKSNLAELQVGAIIQESAYSALTPEGVFVQMDYVSDEDHSLRGYEVTPGVFSIKVVDNEYALINTSYNKDKILADFTSTKEITDRIDKFFERIHIYKEHGIDVPKRAMLLYGPPGGGKSTGLAETATKYGNDGKTVVILWSTDKYEAASIKDFISTFKYTNVERVILIAEDVGGIEIDEVRMKSDSSLLALLDNQEKVFTLPIYIIATTNFPEVFMGNLTNRPGRFDDKIKVDYPNIEQRLKLLEFFNKKELTSEVIELVSSHKCMEFSAAHLREVVLRSAVYEKAMYNVIWEMVEEIELYKKAFSDKKGMGLI
jgi:SpoVK/Ycf46/Vps4 family AAA+-type ATPase